MEPDLFKQAFRRHAAGVAIVTTMSPSGPVALTVSSLTSVSIEPPTLLFSVSDATVSGRAVSQATSVVIHLLADVDLELAQQCADPAFDRFADENAWELLSTGEPSFIAPPVRLQGPVIERLGHGGSTVVVVRIDAALGDLQAVGAPLVYHDRAWHTLGSRSRIV